ncbi:MAG TPA: Zn-binding domain-containing protein, partial [Rectinemataceae bacterium]
GRAGRRGSGSLAVFVASSAPLDQYFARHPEYFLSQGLEMGRVDLDNPYIFVDHLKCSAFELPFRRGEAFGSGSTERVELTGETLSMLEEGGTLRLRQDRWHWSDEGYPSEKVSLRSATADNVVIVDISAGSRRAVGEMDRASAKELLFPNAVYLHLGKQYMVTGLDIPNRLCTVVPKTTEYWTDAVVKTDLSILTEDERGRIGQGVRGFAYSLGDVLVRSQAEKFKKLTYTTHENIGYGDIDLPAEETQTRAISLLFPTGFQAGDYLDQIGPASAAAVLVGAGRLFQALCPAFLLCSPGDIGLSERVRDPHFGQAAIHLYDKYPGGTGLSEALVPKLGDLASAARERIESCACSGGCPSCVGADLAMPSSDQSRSPIKASVARFLELCIPEG